MLSACKRAVVHQQAAERRLHSTRREERGGTMNISTDYIHDRVKDIIISGGENVYPAEIESVLMAHPAVADVAVVGVPSERWGETPKAFVVRTPGAEIAAGELIDYARRNLARYKCPTSVEWRESLPRNPTGKLLKKELRAPYWEGKDRQVH